MLDWDPKGKQGPMTPLPDLVTIHQPKEDEYFRPAVAVAAAAAVVAAPVLGATDIDVPLVVA